MQIAVPELRLTSVRIVQSETGAAMEMVIARIHEVLRRHSGTLWTAAHPGHNALPYGYAIATMRTVTAVLLVLALSIVHAITGCLSVLPPLQVMVMSVVICVLGLVLLRLVMALRRRSRGSKALHALMDNAQSLFMAACTGCASSLDTTGQQAAFLGDLKRWLLAYMALTIQDCRFPRAEPTEQLRCLLTSDELDALAHTAPRHQYQSNRRCAAAMEYKLRRHTATRPDLLSPVSVIPFQAAAVIRVWGDAPEWTLTWYTPQAILTGIVLHACVLIQANVRLGTVLLGVITCGYLVFSVDGLACALERRTFGGYVDSEDFLEGRLLTLQSEMDTIAHEHFRSLCALDSYALYDRSIHPMARPAPEQIPRRPRWRWPWSRYSVSSQSSPSSRRHLLSPPSPTTDDALRKPSLKQVLDMATLSSTIPHHSSTEERRPLLQGREQQREYSLFLRNSPAAVTGDEATDEEDEYDDGMQHAV